MDRLQESLLSAPITEIDGYQYFVHPVSDGVPRVEPALLREIVVKIVRKVDLDGVEKIVTPAAMGIHISTALSLVTDIPVVVIRKRRYGLDGEVALFKETGYSQDEMYINDVEAGDRVVLVDDVLSTGGTMKGIIEALTDIGAEIVDVVAVIKKVGEGNAIDESEHEVKTLVNVDVIDGRVVVVDEHGDG